MLFCSVQKKNDRHKTCRFSGGGQEIRTLAPVTRPTPLAGEPLHHLSNPPNIGELKLSYYLIGGEEGIRTLGTFRYH